MYVSLVNPNGQILHVRTPPHIGGVAQLETFSLGKRSHIIARHGIHKRLSPDVFQLASHLVAVHQYLALHSVRRTQAVQVKLIFISHNFACVFRTLLRFLLCNLILSALASSVASGSPRQRVNRLGVFFRRDYRPPASLVVENSHVAVLRSERDDAGEGGVPRYGGYFVFEVEDVLLNVVVVVGVAGAPHLDGAVAAAQRDQAAVDRRL